MERTRNTDQVKTEACKLGLHNLCDGTGIDENGEQVQCECRCHEQGDNNAVAR